MSSSPSLSDWNQSLIPYKLCSKARGILLNQRVLIFFFSAKMCCWYPLEAPHQMLSGELLVLIRSTSPNVKWWVQSFRQESSFSGTMYSSILTLKVSITPARDDIFFFFFKEKIKTCHFMIADLLGRSFTWNVILFSLNRMLYVTIDSSVRRL